MTEGQPLAYIEKTLEGLTNDELRNRIRMLDNNMKQYKHEANRINHDIKKVNESVTDNKAKIKQNKQLPWLVSNVV